MSQTVTQIGNITVTWAVVLMFAAVLQWALFAGISAFSRATYPKKGMRGSERNLLISSFVMLGFWLAAFDVRSLLASQSKPRAVQAAAVTTASKGSCASIRNDAPAVEVKRLLGDPDEKVSTEATRGPGATIWVYRGSRCAVHFFEDRVEFVE